MKNISKGLKYHQRIDRLSNMIHTEEQTDGDPNILLTTDGEKITRMLQSSESITIHVAPYDPHDKNNLQAKNSSVDASLTSEFHTMWMSWC